MKFATYKIADVSTEYITSHDRELIMSDLAPFRIAAIDDGTGAVFSIPYMAASDADNLFEFGFSKEFIAIFKALVEQGIWYVRLDVDGGDIDVAPTFP